VESFFADLSETQRVLTREADIARLNDARAEANKTIKTIENAMTPSNKVPKRKTAKNMRPLQIGDTVEHLRLGKTGTVTEIPDAAGNVKIQIGIMTIEAKADEVALREAAAKKEQKSTVTITKSPVTHEAASLQSLDLRGKAVDEALYELDNFIDNTLRLKLPSAVIIHGKGTGKLRAAVTQHLRTLPAVASFRLGRFGEGEDGVTIVEF